MAAGREAPCHSQTWSLCWQAAIGRDFLVHPSLAERIRGRLIGAHQRSGRELVDYVLMSREIHVIATIQTDDSAGSVARSFGTVISRWVHEVQPIRSPVLAAPFRAQLIDSPEALLHEVRMLAWRPVHLRLCGTPTHYAHGALRAALGLTPTKGFDIKPLLRLFGDPLPVARAAFRTCIARRQSEQDWHAWELTRGLELVVGSELPRLGAPKALDAVTASLVAAGGSCGIDGALELLEAWVVARIHPTGPLDLQVGSSGMVARARALVACLAARHRLCSAATVARRYHRAKATISEQMAACKSRPADRQILVTPLRRILEESALLRASQGRQAHHRIGFGTVDSGASTTQDVHDPYR